MSDISIILEEIFLSAAADWNNPLLRFKSICMHIMLCENHLYRK